MFKGDSDRRSFIKTVLLSSGAVFLDWNTRAEAAPSSIKPTAGSLDYAAAHAYLRDNTGKLKPTGTPRDVGDVIVVGGGLSGLAAAMTIKKSGKSVLVLDNEPVAGGAVRSQQVGGISAELGAFRFSQAGGVMKPFLAECGLTAVPLPPDAYWVDSSTILHDLFSEKTLRENSIATGTPIAMRNFRNFNLALDPKPRLPLFAGNPELIAEYDMMQGTEIISHFPGAELADWLDVYTMGIFGRTLAKVNPYLFYASYAHQFGDSFDSTWYTCAEGMSAIPAAAVKKVGASRVKSGMLVVRVENVKGGVEVDVLSEKGMETLRAKSAVIAVQKRVAEKIVKNLPGLQSYRMKGIPLSPAITIQLRCTAPLFKDRAFVTWFRDTPRRFTHIQDCTFLVDRDHNQLERTEGEFIYNIPCIPPDTSMHSLESEEWLVQYAQLMIAAVADYAPSVRSVTEEVRVFAWGHAIISALPGMIGQLYPHSSEPFDRIIFGGSDNDLCSTIEGAVGHGVHAAELALALS